MVTIAGEVLFSGSYSLLKKNERLSDVIGRAGGITSAAYIKGGRLIRKRNDEERRRETDVLRMAQSGEGSDSIAVNKLAISDTYTVGVDMKKALSHPGSDYDIVLREGDIVYIPEYINTVKISDVSQYSNLGGRCQAETLYQYGRWLWRECEKEEGIHHLSERYGSPC